MPLKVIGAGQGRTGTMSLKLALEALGLGPCHHMSEIILNLPSAALWVEAAEGRPDWEAVFDGYASAVDAPTCFFWRELADEYPDAKVILTVRDPDAWFDSGQATVLSPKAQEGFQGSSQMGEFFRKVHGRSGWDRALVHDRDYMTARFREHNAEVMAALPKERLLVFEVKDGWGPLCEFLGVEVPDRPFPRVNTRAEMSAMLQSGAGPSGAPDIAHVQEALKGRLGRG